MRTNRETYNLSPSKAILTSVQSDVTVVTAIQELIDNTLDNWRRVGRSSNTLKVNIEWSVEDDTFIIEDNSGGLEEENVKKILALGESTKEIVEGPIGAYGLGAKKAILKLGNSATIKSRHVDEDVGYGFSVDKEWLGQESWEVEKQTFEDLDKGSTVIEISGLKDDLLTIEDLEDQLSETYELFLRTDNNQISSNRRHPINFDFVLVLNGQKVKPPNPTNWSYPPFDSLHPRRFKNIKLERDSWEYPVYLHVTAGLMSKRSSEESGTDIFCQNRKVLSAIKDEKGGFGRSGQENIGGWSGTKIGLKIIIEFETEGDADKLPWDTQKSDIDNYHTLIVEGYRDWVSKIARPYWKADYDSVPAPFLSPYDAEYEHSANNGDIKLIDCEDDTAIEDLPNDDFHEVGNLLDVVHFHQRFGVICREFVREEAVPTYNKLIKSKESNSNEFDNFHELTDVPDELTQDEFRILLEEKLEKVELHIIENEKFRDSDQWWYPIYYNLLIANYPGEKAEIDNFDIIESTEKDDDGEEVGGGSDDDEGEGEHRGDKDGNENDSTEPEYGRPFPDRSRSEIVYQLGQVESQDELEEKKTRIQELENQVAEYKTKTFDTHRSRVGELEKKISKFQNLIDEEVDEKEYQNELVDEIWLFFGSLYSGVDDEVQPWPGGQNDLLIERGSDGFHDIVELKKPDKRLFLKSDENVMSRHLRDALCQLARYLDFYHKNHLYVENSVEQDILKPEGKVVIGRSKKNTRESIKQLESILDSNIQILTYDDLVANAQNAIRQFNE